MSNDVCEANNALYILPMAVCQILDRAASCILSLRSSKIDIKRSESTVSEFCRMLKQEAQKIDQFCDCADCDVLKAKGRYLKLRSAITAIRLGLTDLAQKIELQVSGGICSASPERYLPGRTKPDLECIMTGAYLALMELQSHFEGAHPEV
ncbi:MAG: hypothetical protein IPP97_19000 [Candidatus Obscuribacter sp.]|nr:hypothetical protein [Candidatus Obscuribacter sp.]MBP6348765.1 hypothetical protein [Candidatus Obscuribacter sp.]MBP6591639.1 hypothetical protein [Candidatus Obscuribacter sp.]MBP7575823.1 hypothetical protein [Candidatus Obscuribacter sp.]